MPIGFPACMAISLGSAMGKLADMQRTAERARKRAAQQKESSEEQAEYLFNSAVRFAAAAGAGAADALVADTMAGLAPSEMIGVGLGVLSFTGVLGAATKTARSAAEGALCYSIGARSHEYFAGTAAAELPPGGAVAGEIDEYEQDALIAAMAEERESDFEDASLMVD
ncbi:hypothetical protein LCGC14_0754630 [marine sediment metagenome]|uniref:Uncharacterized protein n=1 Tax=marine sediment metagenome TaxID=412755 RepID=A0A0F9TA07_9ZZZZ